MEQTRMELVYFVETDKGKMLLYQDGYEQLKDKVKKELCELVLPGEYNDFKNRPWQEVEKDIVKKLNSI